MNDYRRSPRNPRGHFCQRDKGDERGVWLEDPAEAEESEKPQMEQYGRNRMVLWPGMA